MAKSISICQWERNAIGEGWTGTGYETHSEDRDEDGDGNGSRAEIESMELSLSEDNESSEDDESIVTVRTMKVVSSDTIEIDI